jgi:protein-S-isoprenylcysteine O-methyltransferase Ste14
MSLSITPFSWPAVIIGLILGVYWLCVLMLVWRTKRTVGRAANFVPPERLGRLLRWIWVPVVLLWIFLPMLMPFVVGLPWGLAPISFPGDSLLQWVAVLVTVVAFAITCVCWIKMGSSWRMGIDPNERTALVVTGPFAYVRNPIYGLSQLLVLTALCALPSPVMLVIALLHMGLMQWEVRREEQCLLQLHGAPYAAYMQNVGRFLPRLRAWK